MSASQSNFTIPAVGVCTLEKFSEQSGVPVGVLDGWKKKGYLPTKSIGKYTLINLVQFNLELLESENDSEN